MGAEVFSTSNAEQGYLQDDPTDPSRKLIRQVLGAVAEYERAMIRLRLEAGRRRKWGCVQSEVSFQSAVLELADLFGWRWYHTHDSRRSAAGFPDLVLVRGDRLIFAELKTERGRVSEAQRAWLDDLTAVALVCSYVEVYTWRPGHWSEIERVLAGRS